MVWYVGYHVNQYRTVRPYVKSTVLDSVLYVCDTVKTDEEAAARRGGSTKLGAEHSL